MNKVCFILLFSLALISSLKSQQNYFWNPVIRGDMADPSVIRIGDAYYATATSSEWAPHYPLFTSKDLVNWTQIGHIFDKQPEWTSNSFWAPELFYHNDKVYCYYTARRKSDGISYIGVATANSPADDFTDHGLLVEFGKEAIDAFIYDDNGQLYISWKAYGLDDRPIEILASKLSDDGLKLIGEPFSLLKDDERIGMEGQYHFKKGDYYYIVYSPHSCCGPQSDYDVYIARSKSFKGPYEKYSGNPILHGGGGDYLSCGHGTAVDTPDGRLFYLFHAYFKGEGFFAGRQPVLQEMYMGGDSWPHFRTGTEGKAEQVMPYPGTVQMGVSDFEDRFEGSKLKIDWTWNFPYSDIKTEVRNRKLLLSGTPKQGNNWGTALCLRPQTSRYTYETLVDNSNKSIKGLTMYGDDKNLIVWGVSDGKLELKSIKDGQQSLIYNSTISQKFIYLKAQVEKGCYMTFFWSKDGENWTKVNEIPIQADYLTRWDRVARPGIIQVGDTSQPAEFSYFKMANIK